MTEVPWSPEGGKQPSKFQDQQKAVDELPVGVLLAPEQQLLIRNRDIFVNRPDIKNKILPVVRARMDGFLHEHVAKSNNQIGEISGLREKWVDTRKIEDEISKSVIVRSVWNPQEHGGIVVFYLARALDRLEVAYMKKQEPNLPPDIDLVVTPASWEWQIPADFDLTKVEPVAVKETEAEAEVERIPIPETAGECVKLVEDRLFGLLQKAIVEKKQTKEYTNDYKAIEGLIKRIPGREQKEEYKKYKGVREDDLSKFLSFRFPDGVYLTEKLTLLLEAMKNLTDRTVEVLNAEGSLMKLGAEKPQTPLAKEMLVTLTNIEPVNWHVLIHMDDLFPEAVSIPETRLDLQKAWDIWWKVGDLPYVKIGEENSKTKYELAPVMLMPGRKKVEYVQTIKKELVVKSKSDKRKTVLVIYEDGSEIDPEDKDKAQKGQIKVIRGLLTDLDYEIKVKIVRAEKTASLEAKKKTGKGRRMYITLKDFYTSEGVESLFRKAVANKMEDVLGVDKKNVRSELLAWCFLRSGLSFDMWDRARWKIKADEGARDLIWFVYKQVLRATAGRTGKGLLETVGSYWALEGQGEQLERRFNELTGEEEQNWLRIRLGDENADRIARILRENEKRAVFRIRKSSRSRGAIIGDFWTSLVFEKDGEAVKASDPNVNLKEIPFIGPRSPFEIGTYASYFNYSMNLANSAVESFMNTGGRGWEVEDFMTPTFWEKQTDLLLSRIGDYCPHMMVRLEEKAREEDEERNYNLLQEIACTFARGILWLGSYKAQPPDQFLGVKVEPKGTYTFGQAHTILRAIEHSGFLDPQRLKELYKEIKGFGYLGRGAAPRQR